MAAIEVRTSVTVNRPAAEVYRHWTRLENLPGFMRHVDSVTKMGDGRSHWVMRGPGGIALEWDAVTVEQREGELIAWRSLPDSRVENSGTVRFARAPGDRGTEVHATITYDPPGGLVGDLFARLFNQATGKMIQEDLRRFKQIMEAGEIPTTEGQPSGREEKERGS